MKAVLCKAFGPPESLVIEEVEPLKPGKGQVVISVKACGVNFPDTLIIQGKYQSKPPFPFIPGSEVAGVVKELGEGVDTTKIGEKVMAFIGMNGFAEEAIVNEFQIVPMPRNLDFASGDIPRIPLNLPLLKVYSIVGVFWGAFMEREPKHGRENIQELITWVNEGKLKPHVTATYPLEHVAEALNDLMERKVTGKAVLVTEA
ncbi:MAG TPA: zinc-binding dehydrogenase [Ktedonobacteraceae bacterium]|nr:zinc-binding dehydrogenase [Ktedonobacteraceae bacterium]